MKKKKTVADEIRQRSADILQEIERWKDTETNGCSDPAWPDGTNMNLIRNHVIYAKRRLMELCKETGSDLPPECYLPTPPYIDSNYFAKPDSGRAQRIMEKPCWKCANSEPVQNVYDDQQCTLF